MGAIKIWHLTDTPKQVGFFTQQSSGLEVACDWTKSLWEDRGFGRIGRVNAYPQLMDLLVVSPQSVVISPITLI
jgi:hypothetical protein